jgi:outer membrane protein TolC
MPRPKQIRKCATLRSKRDDSPFKCFERRGENPSINSRPIWRLFLWVGLWGGFSANASVAGESTLTFAEAWQQVRTVNPALEAARVETDRRGEERLAARSLYGPQVELSARYTMIDEPIVIDVDSIRSVILGLHPTVPSTAIPSFIEPVQDKHFTRAQLTAVWPVYAGGRIRAAQRAAAAGVDEAEASTRTTSGHLFSELVRRFYGAQLARVVRSMRADTLTSLTEHFRQAELLEREGQIARAERLHAQVARDEAERDLMRAETQVQIAQAALAGLFGRDEPVKPDSPLFLVSEPLPSLATFLRAGEAQHPALDMIDAKRAQAAAGVAVERGRLKPEVYLFGAQELNRSDLTLLDPDWAAGVGVRVVLFERSDRTHRLAAAKLQERRVGLLRDDLRDNLHILIEKSYREADLARRQFASFVSTLELAQENLRVREVAFGEGQGTSLDVVDARLTLLRAETARAVSTAEYVVALANLLEASGQPDRFIDYEASATERILP